jgi:programmed cell death 6-interacting protein
MDNLEFERACILFNIGVVYLTMGVWENRSTDEGLKRACGYFQLAAGCLSHLRQIVVPCMRLKAPVFIGNESLSAIEAVAVAQAQECYWQKAILNNSREGIIARLAFQVSVFYSAAVEAAMNSLTFPSNWIHHLISKKFHFMSAAQYRMASVALSASNYGEEVARLREALRLCSKALESGRSIGGRVLEDLLSLQAIIKKNLGRAEKDNDLIYLKVVPQTANLPRIQGAPMVSITVPIEIANPEKLLQKTWSKLPWSNIIPIAVFQASRIYKDKLVSMVDRDVISKWLEITNTATRYEVS